MVAVVEAFSVTDVILVLGILGVALQKIGEARGWTRSSQILRRENEDLLRRNDHLEANDIERGRQVDELTQKVLMLETQIGELKQRDMAAVLLRLQNVEDKADERHHETIGVLTLIATNTSPPVHTTTDEGGGS